MTSFRAWLTLLRPPNFLTVPGDVLAGYFLATGAAAFFIPELLVLIFAAIFFYAGGLLLNDWADAAVDRIERPERPIPANWVGRRAAFGAAVGSFGLAISLCVWHGGPVLLIGIALTLAIANYNLLTKNILLIGPLSMGCCRGLNFLLGATLAAGFSLPPLGWWGFTTITCYITAVTHLAQREMTGRYFALERWLPALVLVAAFFVYLPLSRLIGWPAQIMVTSLFLVVGAAAARIAVLLPNRMGVTASDQVMATVPTPALIGRFIALLIPIQSAFIVGSGDGMILFVLALAVLALWPLKRWLGTWFYSS